MTLQTFRDLLKQQPFQPFRIVMSSGQSYDVRHPEAAFLTQTNVVIGTEIADDGIPDEFKICSLLHISAVQPLLKSANP